MESLLQRFPIAHYRAIGVLGNYFLVVREFAIDQLGCQRVGTPGNPDVVRAHLEQNFVIAITQQAPQFQHPFARHDGLTSISTRYTNINGTTC